jgi:hypothetical protein
MSVDENGNLSVIGTTETVNFKMTGGTPGAGKVLVSDADGDASWQTPTTGDVTDVLAGAGLTKSGGASGDITLDVGAGTGLSVSSDAVALNVPYTDNRYVNEGQANSITSNMIVNGQVNTADLANGSVSEDKIGNDEVWNKHIADNAVHTQQIRNNTIVDADVSGSAAIQGTKIDPDFGAQTVRTTGAVYAGNVNIKGINITKYHDGNFEFVHSGSTVGSTRAFTLTTVDPNDKLTTNLVQFATLINGELFVPFQFALEDKRFMCHGNAWIDGEMSAGSIVDRTPYPADLETAYEAVLSINRLPDGKYIADDKDHQLDHSQLHPFVRSSDNKRDLSATVSAQNEVIKDLLRRIEQLEQQKAE